MPFVFNTPSRIVQVYLSWPAACFAFNATVPIIALYPWGMFSNSLVNVTYSKHRNIGDTLNLVIENEIAKFKTANINVARTNFWPSMPQMPN